MTKAQKELAVLKVCIYSYLKLGIFKWRQEINRARHILMDKIEGNSFNEDCQLR